MHTGPPDKSSRPPWPHLLRKMGFQTDYDFLLYLKNLVGRFLGRGGYSGVELDDLVMSVAVAVLEAAASDRLRLGSGSDDERRQALSRFIFAVLRRKIWNRWRKQRVEARYLARAVAERSSDAFCAADLVIQAETDATCRHALLTAYTCLSSHERELWELRIFAAMSWEQIAEHFGIPSSSARSTYRRAKVKIVQHLRVHVPHLFEDPPDTKAS